MIGQRLFPPVLLTLGDELVEHVPLVIHTEVNFSFLYMSAHHGHVCVSLHQIFCLFQHFLQLKACGSSVHSIPVDEDNSSLLMKVIF